MALRVAALLPLASMVTALSHKPLRRPNMPELTPKGKLSTVCNSIPGTWTGFLPQPLYDEYQLDWTPDLGAGAFSAVAIRGGGWTLGQGFISADNTTATIVFDTGVSLSGNVTDGCTTIMWNNTSIWRQKAGGIDVVHIVSMNHLDVGYNGIPGVGFINNILNRYFTLYFPRAIAIAQALRDLGGPERFIYTTHGWLAHLYTHCAPNMTLAGVLLQCPSPAEVQAFKDAVLRGDIAIQAAAFNTEYENSYDADVIDFHFALSRQVADEIGIPRPWVASLRDVPGTTRSLIPHLIRNNITALSVGVNVATAPPDMPNPGVWLDPATNTSVIFMQHNGGYPGNPGPSPTDPGGMSAADAVVVPGFGHVLLWAFRTDNSGPAESVDEVLGWFDIARYQFPGAEVYASTYENFTMQLATIRDQLPVITGEAGDVWLVGVPSDSTKNVAFRESSRAYIECLAAGQCDPTDPRIIGFMRMLIKMPEHTWGLPQVYDDANWTNAAFHAAWAAGEQTILNSVASWVEQRDIAMRVGFASLGDHPLAADITQRLNALVPAQPNPSAQGFVALPQAQWGSTFSVSTGAGAVTIGFDATTGAIASLSIGGVAWADATHPLALLHYQTLNQTDFATVTSCCFGPGDDAQKIANPQHLELTPTVSAVWVDSATAPHTFLLEMTLPALAVSYYGAPALAWVTVTVAPDASVLVDLQVFNKTSTRLPEAMFFEFTPVPQSAGSYRWAMDKLGGWVDPQSVVNNGAQHQHGIRTGVIYSPASAASGQALMITSLDVPVVSPATDQQPATVLPNPLTPLPGTVTGMWFILAQNAYNTNYLLFSIDTAFRYRFQIAAVTPPASLEHARAAWAALSA